MVVLQRHELDEPHLVPVIPSEAHEVDRLALVLSAEQDRVDLLLFDEVDAGIGGAVAQAVGERLRSLAARRQIVCVTHLPMIAALATRHLAVTKRAAGGRTMARIEALDASGLIEERDSRGITMCGAGPVAAAIVAATALGATRAQSLAYSTSGDVMPSDQVVAYYAAAIRQGLTKSSRWAGGTKRCHPSGWESTGV